MHLILPLHYALQGDDQLLRLIREQQQRKAEQLGLDASLAGLPHFQAYARMFEVLHIERTVCARYGSAHRPAPGFISQLVDALADTLGGGQDQVQKLRKAISACRRGQRARVKWLRPLRP